MSWFYLVRITYDAIQNWMMHFRVISACTPLKCLLLFWIIPLQEIQCIKIKTTTINTHFKIDAASYWERNRTCLLYHSHSMPCAHENIDRFGYIKICNSFFFMPSSESKKMEKPICGIPSFLIRTIFFFWL